MKPLRLKRYVRRLYAQARQEKRMAVDLMRAGFKPNIIPDLIKRFRRYA